MYSFYCERAHDMIKLYGRESAQGGPKMKKIAITGNIAAGKSQVEEILTNYYPVYDADKIAHSVLNEITEFYGYDVFTNGKIDRKKLGPLVFQNPEIRQKLENI